MTDYLSGFRFLRQAIWGVALIAATFALFTSTSYAADPEPGKDHPLVGRYQGSVMAGYHHADFDEVGLISSPVGDGGKPISVLKLEGAVSFYYYDSPQGRSELEIQRNLRAASRPRALKYCSVAARSMVRAPRTSSRAAVDSI